MNKPALAGCRIIVTRPAGQQQALLDAIEDAGGEALGLPLLAIEPVSETEAKDQLRENLARLHEYDIVVFISANAASFGVPQIAQSDANISPGAKILAVGAATAREAAILLDRPVHSPAPGSGSEQLLKMSQLGDVKGRKIAIFRGEGGRELLAAELRKKGAQVDYFEVYRRAPAPGAADKLEVLLRNGLPDFVILTSAEALLRWRELLDEIAGHNKDQLTLLPSQQAETARSIKEILFEIPLTVPSRRVANQAAQLEFAVVINAGDAGAKAIVGALATHLRQRET